MNSSDVIATTTAAAAANTVACHVQKRVTYGLHLRFILSSFVDDSKNYCCVRVLVLLLLLLLRTRVGGAAAATAAHAC